MNWIQIDEYKWVDMDKVAGIERTDQELYFLIAENTGLHNSITCRYSKGLAEKLREFGIKIPEVVGK